LRRITRLAADKSLFPRDVGVAESGSGGNTPGENAEKLKKKEPNCGECHGPQAEHRAKSGTEREGGGRAKRNPPPEHKTVQSKCRAFSRLKRRSENVEKKEKKNQS